MTEHVLAIDPGGRLSFVYTDELADADFLSLGDERVRRASTVEPIYVGSWRAYGWVADLSPVGGPVLGPYTLRSYAVDAEVEWLEQNVIGMPAG